MSNLWLAIIAFSIFTGIVFGIGGFLIHKWWFKPQNNPNKAFIFVDGIDRPYKGNFKHKSSTGTMFFYKVNGKIKTLFVPKSYEIVYHYYRRCLWLNEIGQLIAQPYNKDKQINSAEKTTLIEELTQSNMIAEAVHAMKGKSFSMLIIIIMIVVALAFGVVGYALRKPTTQTPTTTQQNTPAQPTTIIEGSGQTK